MLIASFCVVSLKNYVDLDFRSNSSLMEVKIEFPTYFNHHNDSLRLQPYSSAVDAVFISFKIAYSKRKIFTACQHTSPGTCSINQVSEVKPNKKFSRQIVQHLKSHTHLCSLQIS